VNRRIAVQWRGVNEKVPQIRCETPVLVQLTAGPARWAAHHTLTWSPPAQRSSRRRSNFRCAAIRSSVVHRNSARNRLREILQPVT